MMTRKTLVVAFWAISCSISASVVACSQGTSRETVEGTQRAATFNGKTAQGLPIAITLASTNLASLPYRDAEIWGRHDSAEDTWAVTKFTVTVDGKPLFLPSSAYNDLANVETVDILPAPQGFDLQIRGGETGTAYQSVLTFDAMGILKKRRTVSRNFPDEAWEETTYSFIPDDGR